LHVCLHGTAVTHTRKEQTATMVRHIVTETQGIDSYYSTLTLLKKRFMQGNEGVMNYIAGQAG
jgi:hypothetical protein